MVESAASGQNPAHGKSGVSLAAMLVGLIGGGLFTLIGCALMLSPVIGIFFLAWAIPLTVSGATAWRNVRLARLSARVSLVLGLAGVCVLVLAVGTVSTFDVGGALGLFVVYGALFLPLPLTQVVLTTCAWRRDQHIRQTA